MRRIVWFVSAFAAAVLLYVYLWQDRCVLWLMLAAALAAAAVYLLRLPWQGQICTVCLGLCIGALYCFVYSQLLPPVAELDGTTQQVSAVVMEQPYETAKGIGMEAVLQMETGNCSVLLYADDQQELPQPGDTVTCQALIVVAGTRLLEGENLYLRSSGAVLCLFAKTELEIVKGEQNWSNRARAWMRERIGLLYDGEAAGLVQALLTGDRSGLSYLTQSQMAVAGVSHSIAVSGMHVSILLMMVAWLCAGQPLLRAAIGIPMTILFACLTGGSPSVTRAVIMQVLMLGAVLIKREYDAPTALASAVLALLLRDPWTAANAGFQMSAMSVVGLLLFSGRIQRSMLSAVKKPRWFYRQLVSGISATFSATSLTNPLSWLYFGSLSLAAPLTNLLVLWAVTAVFVLGTLSCLLGPIGPVIAWAAELLANYILWISRMISRFPYAAANTGSWLMLWGLCAYVFVLIWLQIPKLKPAVPAGILSVLLCLSLLAGRLQLTAGEMSFTALDVGQGQCMLLESQGFTAMVDCGGEEGRAVGETAARYLHSAGKTHLDVLVLTHYDYDHISGAVQLMQRLRVGCLLMPAETERTEMQAQLQAAAEAAGTEVRLVHEQMEILFSTGKLQVFPAISQKNENDRGICVLATASEYDILITGDLSKGAEQTLVSSHALPDVELLVAGHHGADSSTSYALLHSVCPESVIISVGADNLYGHPEPATLNRLQALGMQVYRTDLHGTVIVRK